MELGGLGRLSGTERTGETERDWGDWRQLEALGLTGRLEGDWQDWGDCGGQEDWEGQGDWEDWD